MDSPAWTASARRFAPFSISWKQLGSGRKSRIRGSRCRARSSRATPRASSSSSTNASMPSPGSPARRQRHGCPRTDALMPSANSGMDWASVAMASPYRSNLGEAGRGCQSGSEVFYISAERRERSHPVVKLPRRVLLMRLPIDARQPRLARLFIDMLDQRTAYAHAASLRRREQVLQVANVPDHRRVAMVKVMDQPDELSVAFGYRGEHRLVRVEEARPGRFGDLVRQIRPLVEEIVSL